MQASGPRHGLDCMGNGLVRSLTPLHITIHKQKLPGRIASVTWHGAKTQLRSIRGDAGIGAKATAWTAWGALRIGSLVGSEGSASLVQHFSKQSW